MCCILRWSGMYTFRSSGISDTIIIMYIKLCSINVLPSSLVRNVHNETTAKTACVTGHVLSDYINLSRKSSDTSRVAFKSTDHRRASQFLITISPVENLYLFIFSSVFICLGKFRMAVYSLHDYQPGRCNITNSVRPTVC